MRSTHRKKLCIRQNAEFCIFDFLLFTVRYFDYAVFSRNSAFGNAEFQNTVSTERTLKGKRVPFSEKNSSHHHFPNFPVFEFSSRENRQLGGGVLSKIITSWSKSERGGGGIFTKLRTVFTKFKSYKLRFLFNFRDINRYKRPRKTFR